MSRADPRTRDPPSASASGARARAIDGRPGGLRDRRVPEPAPGPAGSATSTPVTAGLPDGPAVRLRVCAGSRVCDLSGTWVPSNLRIVENDMRQ